MALDTIGKNSGRKMRILSGTVQEVEDAFAALDTEYAILHWRWDVVDGRHLLSVVLLRVADLERAMRMQALMAGAPSGQRPV